MSRIPDFKTYIGESIWGDFLDKGTGEKVKKEDDINLLDMNGLYDYIYTIYDQIPPVLPMKSQANPSYEYFSLPVFKNGGKAYRLDASFKDGEIIKLVLLATVNDVKDFKQALLDNFDVFTRSDGALNIWSKEDMIGKVTNQLCLDLIQFIIDNAPDPLLKKKCE